MLAPSDFFNLDDDFLLDMLGNYEFVWEPLFYLKDIVKNLVGDRTTILGDVKPGVVLGERSIYISKGARIDPGVFIEGPAYIGPGVVVRHGAYLRPNVILLSNSVVGHSTEIKSSILLPHSHAPHFNYVGDSILGNHVNLGAGTKLSNLTIMSVKDPVTGRRPTIKMKIGEKLFDTKLEKFGSILGDNVETGCNAVLNPACLVGPQTLIYANVSLRKGYYAPRKIVKLRQNISTVERR